MNLESKKKLVASTGRRLLDEGLVARTWGNISCRIDDETMVITPSGMGYDYMSEEDVVVMNIMTEEWDGERRPSSEKGIHIDAYNCFSDVGYVIHTHQNYATALSLAGFLNMDITQEEIEKLGGISLAPYGPPGSDKLRQHVKDAYKRGAKVVFMAHHGAVVCGTDLEDTIQKAILLEEIAKRNIQGLSETGNQEEDFERQLRKEDILQNVRKIYPNTDVVDTDAGMKCATKMLQIPAQLDDVAQIIGRKIPLAKANLKDILQKMSKADAVVVQGIGILVKTEEKDDLEALKMLVDKAAICYIHSVAIGVHAKLPFFEVIKMRKGYLTDYSKRK